MKKKLKLVLSICAFLFIILLIQELYKESQGSFEKFNALIEYFKFEISIGGVSLSALGILATVIGALLSRLLIIYFIYLVIKWGYWLIKRQAYPYTAITIWVIAIVASVFFFVITVMVTNTKNNDALTSEKTSINNVVMATFVNSNNNQ